MTLKHNTHFFTALVMGILLCVTALPTHAQYEHPDYERILFGPENLFSFRYYINPKEVKRNGNALQIAGHNQTITASVYNLTGADKGMSPLAFLERFLKEKDMLTSSYNKPNYHSDITHGGIKYERCHFQPVNCRGTNKCENLAAAYIKDTIAVVLFIHSDTDWQMERIFDSMAIHKLEFSSPLLPTMDPIHPSFEILGEASYPISMGYKGHLYGYNPKPTYEFGVLPGALSQKEMDALQALYVKELGKKVYKSKVNIAGKERSYCYMYHYLINEETHTYRRDIFYYLIENGWVKYSIDLQSTEPLKFKNGDPVDGAIYMHEDQLAYFDDWYLTMMERYEKKNWGVRN